MGPLALDHHPPTNNTGKVLGYNFKRKHFVKSIYFVRLKMAANHNIYLEITKTVAIVENNY